MASVDSFNLRLSSGLDWFDIEGELEFRGGRSVGLPKLLRALRTRSREVRLDDGSQGLLPEDWLQTYGQLLTQQEVEGNALRFQRTQALLLEVLLQQRDRSQADPEFTALTQRLKETKAPRARRESKRFDGALRGYQREALGWMRSLDEVSFGGCLADEMGLGKTVEVLAHLQHLKVNDVDFDQAILDKAQAIRNHQAQVSKAVRLLRARQRLALSGTPSRNHLGELWSSFEFLNPVMLGRSGSFRSAIAGASAEAREAIAQSVAPFVLRRTKEQVLPDLLPRLAEDAQAGPRALISSQFTSLLSIARTALTGAGYAFKSLDGRARKRPEKVERSQVDPDCPLFLISLKAGGTGLNMTAADCVFLLEPWCNPAAEAHAIDRCHRIGQESPAHAFRLIARDTEEERILEMQASKRELANAVIGDDNALLRDLTSEHLGRLLG